MLNLTLVVTYDVRQGLPLTGGAIPSGSLHEGVVKEPVHLVEHPPHCPREDCKFPSRSLIHVKVQRLSPRSCYLLLPEQLPMQLPVALRHCLVATQGGEGDEQDQVIICR